MPGLAHAVICKTVDADGVVGYTEVPALACTAPVKLSADVPASGKPGAAGGYQSIRILHPEMDAEIVSNDGKVPLVMALEPPLQPGHRIGIFLDDALVPNGFDGLSVELTGVDFGPHRVRAVVFDGDITRLIESAAVRFLLQKAAAPGRVSGPTAPPSTPN
jgi:hypothetical protein